MGHIATAGKEEVSIYGGHPRRRKIDMERPAWVIQKGNQSARQVCLIYKLCAIILCDGPGLSSPSPGLTWSKWESLIEAEKCKQLQQLSWTFSYVKEINIYIYRTRM